MLITPSMFQRLLVLFVCLLATLVVSQQGYAQRQGTVTQNFDPAFHIEPLVQKLEGRRGDVVRFQFKVTPANKDAEIEVSLVGLRQELSGQITYDESEVDNDSIQLLNAGRVNVPRDQSYVIEGVVKVPQGDASYYTYGVLVKDFGTQRDRDSKFSPDGKELTQAGIIFITQYVLRVELFVTNARGERANSLSIEDGQVSVANGLPQLGVVVRNPSDTTFEFEVRTQIKKTPTDRSFKVIRMVMPIRQSQETEDRFVGRLLPKSSVLMRGLMVDPLMSGQYQMEVEMFVADRKVASKSFAIEVDANDFPAQAVRIAQVGGDVYVSPATLELSQIRGGERRITLEFKNNSDTPRTIQLAAQNTLGMPLPGLNIQPQEFTLSGGRSRKLSVSLRRMDEFASPVEYGSLVVSSTSPREEFAQSGKVPLAISFSDNAQAVVEMESIRWVDGKYPGFKALLTNSGNKHLALDARLLIISEDGRRIMIPAGYGRWLMPGEQSDLEFRLPSTLPPGEYQLICDVQNGTNPIVKTQTFSVSDFEAAQTASTK